MAMEFTSALPGVTGDITVFTHQDPGAPPTTVLDIDQGWQLTVEWDITGPGAGFLTTSDWHLLINLESLGPQMEKTLITDTIPGGDGTGTFTHVHYSRVINVLARDPADLTLPDRVNEEGVYRLVAILTHDRPAPFPSPDQTAGFLEGPMLQFYHYAP